MSESGKNTFAELVASRKKWLEESLKPWCRHASQKDLRLAELEWTDIAGKVDPEATLWNWAWGRFPILVHEELDGILETNEVAVQLKDGRVFRGFPNNRQSKQGMLVLLQTQGESAGEESEPISIDVIAEVKLVVSSRSES